MEPAVYVGIALFVLGGIFTVLWFLLRQKDESQEQRIKKLFELHDEDAKELAQHRLMIAENHYRKPELDIKFDKIESSIKDGFVAVKQEQDKTNDSLDRLNAILLGRAKFSVQDGKHHEG